MEDLFCPMYVSPLFRNLGFKQQLFYKTGIMEKFLNVALNLSFVTTQWLQLLSYDKGSSMQA